MVLERSKPRVDLEVAMTARVVDIVVALEQPLFSSKGYRDASINTRRSEQHKHLQPTLLMRGTSNVSRPQFTSGAIQPSSSTDSVLSSTRSTYTNLAIAHAYTIHHTCVDPISGPRVRSHHDAHSVEGRPKVQSLLLHTVEQATFRNFLPSVQDVLDKCLFSSTLSYSFCFLSQRLDLPMTQGVIHSDCKRLNGFEFVDDLKERSR